MQSVQDSLNNNIRVKRALLFELPSIFPLTLLEILSILKSIHVVSFFKR